MAKTMLIIIFFIQSLLISELDDVLCIISKPNSNPPANANGISIDIFHRDSLHSPYYNESLTHTQTLVNAIRRSLNRYQRLNVSLSSAGSTETDVVRSIHSGDYLMRYKIGNQEVPSLGILDTGSSLIWTQCFPCPKCIKQNPPLYEPKRSKKTYNEILCNEFECNRSSYANNCRKKQVKTCVYYSSYEDGTFTMGKLSKDTFILSSVGGTTTHVLNIVFGCSSRAQSNFYGYESGVIGLGRSPDSLVSQLGASAKGKFSYCLVPKGSSSSRMSFGDSAEVSGEGVMRTPLVLKPDTTYYHVTLFGFDINGGTKHMYPSDAGNLIVDSGWAETRLPDQMYADLNRTLIDAMKSLKLKVIDDPKRTLDLCFQTKSDRIRLPTVTLHFGGDNANVSFSKDNMFVRTSPNTLCLAVLPAGDERIVVLGYIAQANFFVGYDTEKEQMSFKPTDCTKIF